MDGLIGDNSINEDLDLLNFIIEVSLLKLKDYTTSVKRRDYERLLVIETLRRAIYNKCIILFFSDITSGLSQGDLYQERRNIDQMDTCSHELVSSMQNVLEEAISNLGLFRFLKLGFEANSDYENELPLLKFPQKKNSGRRMNQMCEQSASGNISPQSKKLFDMLYTDINASTNRFLEEFLID
jgi:hypothetical protein